MTLRSRGSFWSDDVWLVVLISSTVDLEMLTLGHSPLVLVMISWDDSLYQTLTFQRSFCIESLLILRWCIHTGAYPFRSMMVFRHSCSLEEIRFILHWSMRYDWVICLMWSQEHSLLIIVDIFFRWLDQDTDTYESMQRSLVISGFALYWGITLSLAVDLRDISSHWDMLFIWGRLDILFTLPRWLWWADVHFDQMMYDWLYSSHWCLIQRCLHRGIAHSSMMILWDDSLGQTHTSQGLSCTEDLPILRWCIHTGGIPTLLILTLRLHFLLMIAALDGL